MTALRSRRLEGLLGARVDQLTAAHIGALVDAGAEEAFDLDFKRDLYGRGDSERRALAGDVAAMANTAGGLILIGVEEDAQARAGAVPGVEITDAEIGRIRQVVAGLVSPMPTFDVIAIPHSSEDPRTTGYLAIAVPRSVLAPHAVLINDALRYPKRNGTTTRYLSEPEVALAYRARQDAAAERSERLGFLEREAAAKVNRDTEPWILLSLAPELQGDMSIDTSTLRGFRDTLIGTSAAILDIGVTYARASVGQRRLVADATRDYADARPAYAYLELHSDGSGVYGLSLYDALGLVSRQQGQPEQLEHRGIDDEAVTIAVLSGLLKLARHARDVAGAGGDALLRASVISPPGVQALSMTYSRRFGDHTELRGTSVPAEPPPSADTSARLDDLAVAGPALVRAAEVLVDDLGQAFGIPELGQLTREGAIRQRYWSANLWRELAPWAEAAGIVVDPTALES